MDIKTKKTILYCAAILALAIAGWLLSPLLKGRDGTPAQVAGVVHTPVAATPGQQKATYVSATPETTMSQIFKVYISGNVLFPGEYHANAGDTVGDIVERAGGFAQNAKKNKVKLDSKVYEGDYITIP